MRQIDVDLVGVAEIAERLDWSKGRVTTYAARGLLPEPVAELAGGRVWRWEDVEKVAKEKGWLTRPAPPTPRTDTPKG